MSGRFTVADDFLRDVQIGVRLLRRQWGSSVILVLTLALGIGANTAVFSLIETVFLRPLPVHAPERLVLFSGDPGGGSLSGANQPPVGVWNLFSNAAADALLLSRAMGQPVRVQWMRQDEHGWDPKGPAQLHELRGGLDASGNISAWETQMWIPLNSPR